MAQDYLILGNSGSGKSTSLGHIPDLQLKGLNPAETILVNVMGKPLPFKGSRTQYNPDLPISQGGNYLSTTSVPTITQVLDHVDKNRPEVKNVVLDDFQYVLADEFMRRGKEKGYDKFTDIATNAYNLINIGKGLRSNINFFVLSHSEFDDKSGKYKIKTVGKLLDDKVNLEGLFTVVLYTQVNFDLKEKKSTYHFITNRYADPLGNDIPAKSPVGMFPDLLIPNDLGYVVDQANAYYN